MYFDFGNIDNSDVGKDFLGSALNLFNSFITISV